jgi:site-specific recombinase XerD
MLYAVTLLISITLNCGTLSCADFVLYKAARSVIHMIPSIAIFTRHSERCPRHGEEDWRKCNCRKHLRWTHNGKQYRQSARTRSWAQAEEERRRQEQKFASSGGNAKPDTSPKTLDEAVSLFLIHKHNEGVKDKAYKAYKYTLDNLTAWMQQHAVFFPADLTSELLIRYQATWTKKLNSTATRSRVLTRIRGFLRFCHDEKWVERIPKMSKVRVDEVPTLPLTDEEYQKLLDTIPSTFKAEKASRVRALIQLMRHSGLAIRDAVTLERDELTLDEARKLYRVVTKRQKTGTDVSVILPPAVSAEVLAVHNDNARYFFWNTGTGKETSAVTNWQHTLRTLFRAAGFPKGKPHQLRDTFAVGLLLQGIPIEEVSLLLGHASIRTTEKHYSPWVQARQNRLDDLVTATFKEP